LYLAGTPRWFEEGTTSFTKDQPVYEYCCDAPDLIREINSYAEAHLNLVDRKFEFSTIDYDYISMLKDVPLDMIHAGETLEALGLN